MIHVVLFEPEIPQNTGNILRSAIVMKATLHVIHPLGFLLSEQAFKRAKMDYGDFKNVVQHDDWDDFITNSEGDYVFVTRYGHKKPNQIDMKATNRPLYLIFGKESSGLPLELLADHLEACVRIPMISEARSLNLANTVAIMLYEVNRQRNFSGLSDVEVQKGEDWLEKHKQ
jgi:tRNA (cytidine/uridine-2'-O-)-methyltransferase